MGINWKVRFKNPVFWAQIAVAIIAPMLAAAGIAWEQVTSWPTLWQVILDGLKNPVVVVAILVGLFNVVPDATTRGVTDSERALGYTEPK